MSAFRWPLLAASLIAGVAPAQGVAPPPYKSALSGYQAFRDVKPANWRELNDTVGALGGHRAHVRDAEGTAPGTPRPIGQVVDPHAGHGVIAAPAAATPSGAQPAAPHGHDMKSLRGMP
jgi:hypothetical protein